MAKLKGRAKEFAEFDEQIVKEHDPEADIPIDSDDEEDEEENGASTEHYETVGKSKIRRKEAATLGPQYRGARVSRAALEEESAGEGSDYEDAQENVEDGSEEYDDPDEINLDEIDLEGADDDEDVEIESDNAFNDSDEETFKDYTLRGSANPKMKKAKRATRPTAADFMDSAGSEGEDHEDGEDEDDEDEDEEDSETNGMFDLEAEESDEDGVSADDLVDGEELSDEDDEDEEEDDDDEDDDEDEEDDDDENGAKITKDSADPGRKSLQSLFGGQDGLATSLTSAMQKDVSKGLAVRKQRQAFDALLNIRIRLQKALVSVNSFDSTEPSNELSEPYDAAEAAALKLWNALDSFRSSMQSGTTTGQKRKRELDSSASSQEIWESMEGTERRAASRRKVVLENWSSKARNMRMEDKSQKRQLGGSAVKPLTTMLEDQLLMPERLIKRTQTPRSCAPLQASRKVNEDVNIYDDADFYQLLLKELVDQRTTDTSSTGGQAATIRFAAVKEAKAKKHVDTRASKGRKMRFNVHEKLQNFMAPEDRRDWEQSAIDRFFGTLFGQKMELNEDEASDEDMGGAAIEEEEVGLRLFS